MNELTLRWHQAGQIKTQKIYEHQPSKNSGTVRIGRDPVQCDVVLMDPTVSGLHVEIFFGFQQSCFYLRNLRTSNPPIVDGRQLIQGQIALSQGSVIYLGQIEINVIAISLLAASSVPQTMLIPPQPQVEQAGVGLNSTPIPAPAYLSNIG